MKFSIITPTHNTKFLKELEETILANTYTNWEWIILLNNGVKYEADDSRIKVYESKITNGFVGALKKEACSLCTGDVIVEVDHDDLLTDDCLYELSLAYKNPKVGFVYSDNAKLSDDFVPYSSLYGWEHYAYNHKGKDLFAMKSQPLYPARLGYIWYAPDHVRSWRKNVYDMVGGHNENMDVLDDQDLIHKLYMVTEFYHIPKVLYIYRITGNNTWLKKNEKIQNLTVEIFNTNITLLAERFAEKNKLMKIDLCGGFNKPQGYLSVDKFNGDIIADLDEGIPLSDGSCGVVRAFDALEHIKDTQHIMKEIHRVLAVGGVLISNTPSTDGRGAWQDPTHCCHSADTEVFTDNGFKFFYDLKPDDYIFTYNDENGMAEPFMADKFFEYDYDGELIQMEGRASSCMVTPNHNMYIGSSDETTNFRFVRADVVEKLKSPQRVPSNVKFIGDYPEYFEIPDSKYRFKSNPKSEFIGDSVRLKIEPFMKFMGWFLSDGCCVVYKTKNNSTIYRIFIAQSETANKEKYEMIGDCLRELGYNPYKTKNGWIINDKYLAIYLHKLGKSYEKYIPEEIKQLDPVLLEMMIETMILGDGNKNGITSFTYSSTSQKLASDFQEIAIKCGYRTSMSMEKRIGKVVFCNPDYRAKHDMYRVYMSSSNFSYTPRDVKRVKYTGKVYCVEMPKNNVILTRRNGKTMWTGNSFYNENSFWYWTKPELAQYIHNDKLFREGALYTWFPSEFHKQHNIPYVKAILEKLA